MAIAMTAPRIAPITFVCRACHRNFVREQAYIDHECKQLKRERELKSPEGQAAWQFYHTWMRLKKRAAPPADAFVASKYFRTFVNFVTFVKKVQLPLPDKFIWLMVKRDFPPTMWMSDAVYSIYLEFLDTKMPPVDQAKNSVKTLLEYSDMHHIDPEDIFATINPNELIQLIRLRKLSPWLLLFSRKFGQLFASLNEEQQSIIETLIKPEIWAEKKSQYPSDIEQIKAYITEMGI